MDKKAKKRLEVINQRLQKLRLQMAGAKKQADEPDEVEKLQAEIDDSRTQQSQLKAERKASANRIEELQARIADLETEVSSGEEVCAHQAWEMQQHKEHMAAVQHECDAMADRFSGTEQKYQAMVHELNQKCQLAGADNNKLEARIKESSDEIEALSEKLEKYEAQHKRVSMEREELEHL